jgi:nicotinamide-nucleotide amidase
MSDSLADRVQKALLENRKYLVTAESCTGGMLGVAMTETPGASKVFDRGYTTYSNEAKMDVLKVPMTVLEDHGAVSAETAKAMAEGALAENKKSHISVSITGIAGPGGGSDKKPVGLVYIGLGRFGEDTQVFRHLFDGDRDAIRKQTIDAAFRHILDALA